MGFLAKENAEQRFLLMVGYSPNKMPYRGADGFVDLCRPEVIEKACWRFMENGAGAGIGHQPGGEDAFKVVENYIYRNPVPWELTAADGSKQVIKEGDWVLGIVLTPESWSDYKKGRWRGGSLQGKAERIRATPEVLARVRS